jgi:hypothetical protein
MGYFSINWASRPDRDWSERTRSVDRSGPRTLLPTTRMHDFRDLPRLYQGFGNHSAVSFKEAPTSTRYKAIASAIVLKNGALNYRPFESHPTKASGQSEKKALPKRAYLLLGGRAFERVRRRGQVGHITLKRC